MNPTTATSRRKAGGQAPSDLTIETGSNNNNGHNMSHSNKPPSTKTSAQHVALCLLRCTGPAGIVSLALVTVLWACYAVAHSHVHLSVEKPTHQHAKEKLLLPFMKHKEWVEQDHLKTADEIPDFVSEWKLPMAFDSVLQRSQEKMEFCTHLQTEADFSGFDPSYEVPFGTNDTVASLPSFGIVDHLQRFRDDPNGELGESSSKNPNDWQCQLPPETECQEHMLTVVFMAYNPDRLKKTLKQIRVMLTDSDWKGMVEEIVLVWNGPRSIDESDDGKDVLHFAEANPLRVVYPLRMGLENDLMNRYHPKVVQIQTKAILYYDDDGPFYSFAAVQGGFELWKRHARSQIGAMARELTYGTRQRTEHDQLLRGEHANDRAFVSHCTNVNDKVDYNYRYFANYDANMVLPSGSLLHSNYLCFLWHPVLEPIRNFVRQHPVHPDDVTVSTVVSQLGGRAPRVYSRRLNKDDDALPNDAAKGQLRKGKGRQKPTRRRLSPFVNATATIQLLPEQDEDADVEFDDSSEGLIPTSEQRRRLMHSICWDCKGGMDEKKKMWAALRTEAINALTRYFGSINSGSIGWCEGSPYYSARTDGRCKPGMAKIGWLPWMNPDGSPKDTCP